MVVRLQDLKNFNDNRRPLITLLLKIIMAVLLKPLKDFRDYRRPLTTLYPNYYGGTLVTFERF